MKSLNEKSYETELNAIKEKLPELDEIIHKIRADNQFKIERKAKNDLVTSADLASEAFIINRFSELFPDDVIWAEEIMPIQRS